MISLLIALQILTSTQQAQRAPAFQRRPARQPNIVLILADDLGVDLLSAYQEAVAPPCTPNIDALANSGLLFRNAWTNPVCTPTRAAVLTGRHGFRTGIGDVGDSVGLPLAELTIPEMPVGYQTAAVGKWHLAGNLGDLHPNETGFGYFAGPIGGGLPDYFQWPKVINGRSSIASTYATTDTTDEAIAAISTMSEPWFTYVAFNSPHTPWHEPPPELCPASTSCSFGFCDTLHSGASDRRLGKAMVEAMDTEIGRLLDAIDAIDPNAIVVFMGDNGSPGQLTRSPFEADHAKGTMYEGGVNVPLIVRAPGITQGECQALVSSVDLFATFAELAGISAPTEDSVSLLPYFRNANQALREVVYTERFSPNGSLPPIAEHSRCVRNSGYKLIRINGQQDQFYDLLNDPFETTNLIGGLSVAEQIAFDQLEAELVFLGVD